MPNIKKDMLGLLSAHTATLFGHAVFVSMKTIVSISKNDEDNSGDFSGVFDAFAVVVFVIVYKCK